MADGGETLLGGKDAVPASSCPALPAEAELLAALGISAADLDIARQVPKVELHCHLDGSLSEAFVQRQMQRRLPGSIMLSPTADLGFATCQAWIHACKSDVPWSGKLMPEGMVGVRGEGNTGPMDIFNVSYGYWCTYCSSGRLLPSLSCDGLTCTQGTSCAPVAHTSVHCPSPLIVLMLHPRPT